MKHTLNRREAALSIGMLAAGGGRLRASPGEACGAHPGRLCAGRFR
jgi:hypothetical protein